MKLRKMWRSKCAEKGLGISKWMASIYNGQVEKEEPERKLGLSHTRGGNPEESGMWSQKRDFKGMVNCIECHN